jgi:4-diphosphocytidyl-2-C-methyl-D-erythritol kinase
LSPRALYDVPAPAKINLFLHIVGRRTDGYHLLESIFALIDWADTLHFERRADGHISRQDLGPALPAEDLCLRAARSLQAASGTRQGVHIAINKQVPWGAGMGGGSSDAASTLLALNRLWGLNWPRQRLAELGLRLGADVPFFIGGTNAFVQGVGERLTHFNLPAWAYAVVKPPAGIATRELFEHPALKRDTEPIVDTAILLGSLESSVLFGTNDLQGAAESACAEVGAAADWLHRRYGNSRMTGSGSAVFSRVVSEPVAGGPPRATFPADELPPGWVGRMCLGLRQHPLRGWAD